MKNTAIVITSVGNKDLPAFKVIQSNLPVDWELIVVGDTKTPADFTLKKGIYLDVLNQEQTYPSLAKSIPYKHYSRKNLGYIHAAKDEAIEWIIDTDDDNIPNDSFWVKRSLDILGNRVTNDGWTNIYQPYSSQGHLLWPRGLPLEFIKSAPIIDPVTNLYSSPIQQGLADNSPDVDAIFRLLFSEEIFFKSLRHPLVLSKKTLSPFNSQNTSFHRSCFPLLYLPSFCSFRMTDIWRSFVALRVISETSSSISFGNATVTQHRNDHIIINDFADEIPGYLHNNSIVAGLFKLKLPLYSLKQSILECYQYLEDSSYVGKGEVTLCSQFINYFPDSPLR
jgi:hypothetical protein